MLEMNDHFNVAYPSFALSAPILFLRNT